MARSSAERVKIQRRLQELQPALGVRFSPAQLGQLAETITPADLRFLEERAAYVLERGPASRGRRPAGSPASARRAQPARPAKPAKPAKPPPPPPPPPRALEVPLAAPAGAAVSIRSASLSEWLRTPDVIETGLDDVRLALDALALEAAENFDRLLAVENARELDHYPHQVETALKALKRFRGRVLLADEVGLGKTIEAGLILSEYLLRGLARRALILVPPALVKQWHAELEAKFGIAARTTLDSSFRADPVAFFAAPGVVVASLATARIASNRALLLEQRFDLVIVDEAHHVKNRHTRSWELVNALRSQFLLLLTATPIETDLGELYNLVTLLRPGTLGTEAEFRRRFTRKDDALSPKDPEALRELLREVMIRNTRAASGVALPPRAVRTVVVEPTPGEQELYQALIELTRQAGPGRHQQGLRLLLEEAGSSAEAVASTAERVQAGTPELAAGLRRVASLARQNERSAKVERLLELVPGGKLLVFTRFRATHDALVAALTERGVACASFHGGHSAQARSEAVERFRGPVDVMICSEVGGEGQNLQFCHRMVNYDLPWNPMLIEQRLGRIHRIGQTEPVEVVNLCTGGTAEERILEVLDQRVNLFELVVGELDMILGEVEDERGFGDEVYSIYASSQDDAGLAAGFEALGDRLAGARRDLDRAKSAADAAFGDALGT